MKQILSFVRSGWDDGLGREEEKKLFLRAMAFAFLFGLLAHGYGFLQDSFSHDALNALYADGTEVYWKMQLGRFGTVLYRRLIRVPLDLPWLLGLLSLFWAGLAAWLTAKLLRLRSALAVALTAGVLTVNLSTAAMGATYLYEMDMNLFAVMLAAAAVLLWDRYGWPGTLLGAVLTAGVLSLYQSLVAVAVGLVMLCCVQKLLTGTRFGRVFLSGLRSLVMLALGGGLYYGLLRLMVRAKDIPLDTGSYNSVFKALEPEAGAPGLPETLRAAYRSFAAAFFDPSASHLSRGELRLHALLLILTLALLLLFLLRGKTGRAEKLLLLALTALLPLGLNAARLFSGRDGHDLMKYAFWLVYLLPLLLAQALPGEKPRRAAAWTAAALLLLLLWDGAQTANAVYVKKDLEQDATLSLMTRVLGRLEAEEDYVPGETELVFVGADAALNPAVYGFESYYDVTGADYPSAIPFSDAAYYYNAYEAYFRYVLNTRVRLAEPDLWMRMQKDERVEAMPAYPAQGCIERIGELWIVKLGEPVDWGGETEGAA